MASAVPTRPLPLQGTEPSYLERAERLHTVLCSTMEKVGGVARGAGPRGRAWAARGRRPAEPPPLPRACWAARTSCGSV